MAGVRVPPEPFTLAPTPPPDIDVEKWEASLATIAGWEPQALGADPLRARSTTPPRSSSACARACTPRPTSPPSTTRTASSEAYSARVHEHAGSAADAILQAAPPDQLFLGLQRYLKKAGRVPSE